MRPASPRAIWPDTISHSPAWQALNNLEEVLGDSGAKLTDVAKCTVFLADIADYAAFNEVYAEFFGDHKPARSAVAVSGLPLGALVEIEAFAYVG